MKQVAIIMIAVASLSALLTGTLIQAQKEDITPRKYPDISLGRGTGSKGREDKDKLTPELRMLLAQYKSSSKDSFRRPVDNSFSPEQLHEFFGITDSNADDPVIGVAVTTNSTADISALRRAGMKIFMRQGNTVYGEVPLLSLTDLISEKNVVHI